MNAIPISRYLAELPGSRGQPQPGAPGQAQLPRITRIARLSEYRVPETDPAVEIEKAYQRGVEDGRSAAAAEHAKEMEALQGHFESQRLADRLAWTEAEASRFADALEQSMAQVESRIGEQVAEILTPYLGQNQRQRAVEELVAAVSAVTQRRQGVDVYVSGPEDMLEAIAHRLGGRVDLTLEANGQADVRIMIDDTLIELRLAEWMAALSGGARG